MRKRIGLWVVLCVACSSAGPGAENGADTDGADTEESDTDTGDSDTDSTNTDGTDTDGTDTDGTATDDTDTDRTNTDSTETDDTDGTDTDGTDTDGTNTDDTDTDGTDTDTDPPEGPCADPGRDEADFAHVYHVGPGQPYETPSAIPWEALQPSTLVLIHWRAQPYRDKWVIATAGTADDPVVVRGVPNGDQLPVISGENATTRSELNFWNENRAVIKIGGGSAPSGAPAHVALEYLEIRSAHPDYSFTDASGSSVAYESNAASVYVEIGSTITIRGCNIHDSGNGLFVAYQASDVAVVANYVHGNGIAGSIYEHNSYTEASGILFECNRYDLLREGAGGNNLKDRSAGTVIRYNWLDGGNRQLDLVDSGHSELIDDPAYRETLVYGNVFVEPDGQGNRQIIHYGGDGDEANYRRGTLYLFHNTIVSTRADRTSVLRLSTDAESAEVHGNIVYVTAGGSELEIAADGTGDVSLTNNWLSEGWTHSFVGSPTGSLAESGNLMGLSPALVDLDAQDFGLSTESDAIDAAGPLPAGAEDHPLTHQYVRHLGIEARPTDGLADMGAFERP